MASAFGEEVLTLIECDGRMVFRGESTNNALRRLLKTSSCCNQSFHDTIRECIPNELPPEHCTDAEIVSL